MEDRFGSWDKRLRIEAVTDYFTSIFLPFLI